MKKLIAVVVALGMAGSALAGFSADVKLKLSGHVLKAAIVVHGLANCPKAGSVTTRWTPPAESGLAVAEFEAPWHACDAQGNAHTSDTYDIVRKVNGKKTRVNGTWKIELVSDGKVFGSAEYVVEAKK